MLNGGRSRRGKPRGPPGSRELQTALKGTRILYQIYLFEPFVGDLRVIKIILYVIGCDDPLFLDFIRRCLEWDPTTRMNPSSALRHAWLRYLYLPLHVILGSLFSLLLTRGRFSLFIQIIHRRRLPRPPPVGGSTDSPSGTLNSTSSSMLRTPTASNSSRTSRDISTANPSMSQKMNTISTVGSSGGQSAKVCICSYH